MPRYELLYRCEREPFAIIGTAETAEEAMEKALPAAIEFSGNAFTNCYAFREIEDDDIIETPYTYLTIDRKN